MPSNDDTPARPCPVCTSGSAQPLPQYSRDGWHVVSCRECGHVYLKNPPGYGSLISEFAWEKTYVSEHDRRLRERPISYRLDLATRFRHRIFRKSKADRYRAWFGRGNLLDIGCGGSTSWPDEFVPFGIEISEELARKADRTMRARGGFCVHGPGAQAIWEFEPETFDGIVMSSYLEHEEHPLRVLEGAYRALRPTGAIYVRVPNYGSVNRRVTGRSWCGFRWPDHLNYFTVRDLRNIAARAGLKVRLLNPIRLPFDDNINALLSRAR